MFWTNGIELIGFIVTYSSFANCAFSESIEVYEELFDSDTVLENISLKSLLYV